MIDESPNEGGVFKIHVFKIYDENGHAYEGARLRYMMSRIAK